MKAPKVRWDIGDAPSTLPLEAVQGAAQAELERLLAEKGMPSWLSPACEVERFEAADRESAEPADGSGVGRKIAKAVYGGPHP